VIARSGKVGQQHPFVVVNHGPRGNQHDAILAARATSLPALTMAPAFCLQVRMGAQFQERSDGTIGLKDDAAARPPVSTIGTALWLVRLMVETNYAVTTGSSHDLDTRLIDKCHLASVRP
jgi:hypothetical protein